MSLTKLPFEIKTTTNIDLVYKEIGIDADKIENSLKLVKEWLKCESYLPDNIDEILLKNFVLGCKGNIENIKEKLEKYLVAKTVLHLYRDRAVKEEDYFPYPYHRLLSVCPKQTPERNRIIIIRMPQKDPANFNHFKWAKYFCLIFDVLLSHDLSAGYHIIYDMSWLTPQYLAKFDIRVAKQVCEIFFSIFPLRVKSFLIINDSPSVQVILKIGKVFMSKKMQGRIFAIKIENLPNYHPIECLPKDYGGIGKLYDDLSDEMLEFMKRNSEWCIESEKLKLVGPIPNHRNNMYSFEDFNMDGSFRKLGID